MSTRLLASKKISSDRFTAVIPMTISQDMRKRKDTLKKKNMMMRKKNITTHKIVIVNQAMRLQPIRSLMTRKVYLL